MTIPNRAGRFIGLDLHKDTIYVTVLSPLEGSALQYEISTKEKDFEAFLGTLRPDDNVALEATRGSRYYVKRLLTRVGTVAVANPMKTELLSGKTAKNDRNDSFGLAFLLALGALPTVWVPDDETQQDREILHYRMGLVQEETRIKNRIRAQLAERGLSWPGSDLQSQDARLFLTKIGTSLPWATQQVLACQLEQLEKLEKCLQTVNDVVEVRAARRPEVALLMTIRGLSSLTALTLLATIGPIERFESPGSLTNFAGLVPCQRASAGHSHQGKITKAGSKMLRWALTEAVKSLTKQDGPFRNLARRLERRKNKAVAMTACARKLLEAIWHMLTRGETFRYAEPELVERKVRRREQRLIAARERLGRSENRRKEILRGRLALLQELARCGTVLPLPEPLKASFGRRRTTKTAVA